VSFQADYDKIELHKISYDDILVTSSKNVTKFFHLGPLPIKISGYNNDMRL